MQSVNGLIIFYNNRFWSLLLGLLFLSFLVYFSFLLVFVEHERASTHVHCAWFRASFWFHAGAAVQHIISIII
jgi:hypothetical protein